MFMPAAEIAVHPNQTARIGSPWGFPLREDVALTDSSGVKPRADLTRVRRAMGKLQEPLRQILEPGEAILYFARGQIMPGKPERYLLGVQSHSLAPAALIFTNRRLLHLSLHWHGRWSRSVRSARLGDLKEFRTSTLLYGRLHVEYRDGSRETYWRLQRDSTRKIQTLLDVLLPGSEGDTSPELAMASLCPRCHAPLTAGVYECGSCHLKFKNETSALLHTLLIPGGGYFYAGMYLWGVAHACVDVSLLASALVWALGALGKVHPQISQGFHGGKLSFTVFACFVAAILLTDLWLGYRVARTAVRNFIPGP
jgi:hypothetical protein